MLRPNQALQAGQEKHFFEVPCLSYTMWGPQDI